MFEFVLDYPRMYEWYPPYRVEVIGKGGVAEGSRLRRASMPDGSPMRAHFKRAIRRADAPRIIEETCDAGDLAGEGYLCSKRFRRDVREWPTTST